MKSKQSKLQTARRRDAWLTTRERKRSTKLTNEGNSSLPNVEIHFNYPVGSVVLHADFIRDERREP